jgi:hypothetical protein
MEDLTAENSARTKPSDDISTLRPASSVPAGPSAMKVRTGASARLLCLATLASVAAAAVWVIAAGMTASHGLDSSDEGFYLLSYRWWNTELRTFTGAQFVYGPVFELLGHNIAGLRLVRLLTIIAANAAFGWTFMRWLRLRRPNAAATRWWEAAGTAAIVACGGMNYSWLPLSPGYNDLSLLGALLAAAVVLKVAADVGQGRTVPVWVPMSIGPVAFAMLVAKWSSSGLTLLAVAIVGIVILVPAGVRQVARVTAWALVGLVFSAIFVQLFIIRLDQAIPQMIATNKLVAAGANNPVSLFPMYLHSLSGLITRTAQAHVLLLITAAIAVAFRNKISSRVIAVLGVTTVVLSFWILLTTGGFTGGNVNIRTYSVGLTLVLAITVIVALGTLLDRRGPFNVASSLRRESWRDTAIVVMLLALPLTQAAGTGNPIYYMAFNCFSAWAALIILVLTGIEGAPPVARALTAAAAAGAVLMSSAIGTSALWFHPYRTSRPSLSNAVATGVPPLSSVTLAPRTAAIYGQLHRVLEPYLIPGGGTYMMGFNEQPGIIFALDGRSVGEAWYSNVDPQRTAAGIRAACPDGRGPWGSRPPILLFSRAASGTETAALKACGLELARDYRQLGNSTKTMGFRIYVGTAELAAHGNGAH